MLKLADLAGRPDFDAGPLHVSPARRSVEGPAGRTTVEPIVMKVFLLLLDAGGSVVTRDELFGNAWGGVFVGDDSLNRAIARVRKIATETAPGLFEIETIPRTGYRLTGEIVAAGVPGGDAREVNPAGRISRRALVGGAAGVGLAGAAGLTLWSIRSKDGRRFSDLLRRGIDGLEFGDGSAAPAHFLEQAVAMRPNDAAAQGLLAYALIANSDYVYKGGSGAAVDAAEEAASASLRLDPENANAQLAQIELQRSTLDLAGTEDRLRGVLAAAPDNIFAMRLLWNLLQSAGRSREALATVQRAITIKPLAAANNFPLGQLLWIVGRTAEADRIIDRAMQFWPTHRYVRFARFTIFAFTGRPRAALAMLDDDDKRPQNFSPASLALWRTALTAFDQPSPANIAAAHRTHVEAAKRDPKLAAQAVLTFSALGDVSSAFDIANDLLVFRVPGASSAESGMNHPRASSTAWRFTPWLFTPPAARLRADPRFAALCDGVGLTDYWTKRGIKPDYQRA
jgi:DNA-binding winged helix-turn-helix (wHTH) protein/tetratricopeptide (TPR) repeat protein